MSVEISGPTGYEVQYLVTIWIALLAEESLSETASLRVEEKEDAALTLIVGNSVLQLAMQSKYHAGDLDAKTLAAWLAHFAAHSQVESLAGRLLENDNQIVLFVTRARCTDATKTFIKSPGDWRPHLKSPLNKAQLTDLCSELSKQFDGVNTPLGRLRAIECKKLSGLLAAESDKLRRVLIWEQITKERLEEILTRQLEKFRIPKEKASSVIRACLH